MTRTLLLVTAVACALVAVPTGSAAAVDARSSSSVRSMLRTGQVLQAGQALRSPDGRYSAVLRRNGRLVVRHGRTVVWRTTPKGSHSRLVLRRNGNLVLLSARTTIWSSRTAGSRAGALTLGNRGILTLRSAGGTAWSSRLGNTCRAASPLGKRVLVDLGQQAARLCDHGQQVLATPITSGMSAYGYGTPTGTWFVQGKYRDTTLYPAAGGAYPVDFWMPYDGVYGMHDSSWQTFPYGSPKYRTQGSHGCIHFPHAAIAWMFRWAPVGTMVSIRS